MKAGFKPRLFTRREWTDNIASVCLQQGVEACLDKWQDDCTKPLSEMTEQELVAASQVATLLDAALNKAAKKCGALQKESKAGIGEYKKIVKKFQDLLKDTLTIHHIRDKFRESLTLDMIFEDREITAAFFAFAKQKFFEDRVKAYVMFKQGHVKEMVRTLGPGDDYNLGGEINKVLLRKFVQEEDVPVETLKAALSKCKIALETMLRDQVRIFKGNNQGNAPSEAIQKYLIKRWPAEDFRLH
jgi:hypothetical protein